MKKILLSLALAFLVTHVAGRAAAQTQTTLTNFTFSSSSITGGSTDTTTGTVTIQRAAGDNTLIPVSLSSDNGAIGVPGQVNVGPNSTSATFTVRGTIVGISTSVNITASFNASISQSVTVVPLVLNLTLTKTSFVGGSFDNGTATVSVDKPVHDRQLVTLACGVVTFQPTTISIEAGTTTSIGAVVNAGAVVGQTTSDTLTATLAPYYSQSQNVTSTPFTLTVTATSVITFFNPNLHNQLGSGTVKLGQKNRDQVTVLLSDDKSLLAMPSSIAIPPNQQSGDFNFTAGAVSKPTVTILHADIGPGAKSQTNVEVLPITGGQKRCPDCEGNTNFPIDLTTANAWVEHTDYSIPGLGGGITFTRYYNGIAVFDGVPAGFFPTFSGFYRSTYDERLQFITGAVNYWQADGTIWEFVFDTVNSVYTLAEPQNVRASLTVDSVTGRRTITFKNGSRKVFDANGFLLALLDANGNQTTVTYDASQRIARVQDAGGNFLQFNYNGASTLLSSLQDAQGVAVTYTGNTATYADGTAITDGLDNFNRISNVTDGDGKLLEHFEYNGDNPIRFSRANGVDAMIITYISPTQTQVTDSLGHVTTHNFALAGGANRMLSVSGVGCASCGGQATLNFTTDTLGNRTSTQDANNHTTSLTYDADNNVATRTLTIGGVAQIWQYTYNSFGEVLTSKDPLGNVTTNIYDTNGNLKSTQAPSPDGIVAGPLTQFSYDPKGELHIITDPRGNITTLDYFPSGLLKSVTDATPQHNVTSFEYDTRGNRTAVVDAAQNRTTFAYDGRNHLTKVMLPDTTHTDFHYDHRGRRDTVTDANGHVTTYAYDDADRLISVTDANSGVTQYAYDTENNLTKITDALLRETKYDYYPERRLKQTTFPSLKVEGYTYDLVGNLKTKTDRKNQTITYNYDEADRLTSKVYPDSSSVGYTYDLSNRLTNVTDATGSYDFTYDNMGRLLTSKTTYAFIAGKSFTNTYGYDAASNRNSFTYPDNSSIGYIYDELNRLFTLTDTVTGQFDFRYDNLGRRLSLNRPNGVKTNYGYDTVSNLTSVLHKLGTTTIDGVDYSTPMPPDPVGNRMSKTSQLLGTIVETYLYDPINQLTQLKRNTKTTVNFNYDKVGNRLGNNYDPSSNHLMSTPTASYTYDDNGNLNTKTEFGKTTSYTWDFENRLTSVTQPKRATATFKYDPFGKRIQKVFGGTATNFIYDGPNISAEMDGSGAFLARYTQGANTDEPLVLRKSGSNFFYEADSLGSTTSITDSNGKIINAYRYDGFGNHLATTQIILQPLRYTAREFDSETSLYYYRARYYDPSLGRFLSEDPLGYSINPNFYIYVGNDPIGQTDPLGLCPCGYHSVRLYYAANFEGGYPDYHWYRQDKNGKWSSKHGWLPVGPQVTDPNQDAQTWGYDVFCGALCAPNDKKRGEPPAYDPGRWNDPDHVHTNNCYSYACDRLHPPGRRNKPQPGGGLPEHFKCIDVINAAKKDGLKDDN